MNKLIIVGLGGIGSHLVAPLLQFLNYEKNYFNDIWLVDGDKYEEKNLNRQLFSDFENKALTQARHYNNLYNNININFIDKYITEDNINKIVKDDDVVLLCVDNNATRKMFDNYISNDNIKNLTIINGGNEYYDGGIMVMVKQSGVMITKTFSELHPEILEDVDKNPNELSCDELSNTEGGSQLGIINASVADLMRIALFSMIAGRGIKYEEVLINGLTGVTRVMASDLVKRIKL